jgi:hypothetical protein
LRQAGIVLGASVNSDSYVDLDAMVIDETAAQKVAQRTYTGIVVSFDGDEISDVSLVDAPMQFLEKRGGKVIVKLYNGGGTVKEKDWKRAQKMAKRNGCTAAENYAALQRVQKAYAPALPPAVEKALQERQRAEDAYRQQPNAFTKAAFVRADTATRIAVIGAQRPAAVGDGGMINFLRRGRA